MTQRLVFCAARRGAGALPPMAVEECTVSIRRRLSSCVQSLGVSVVATGWRVASRMYSTDSSPPSTTSETDELFAMMEQEEAFVPVSNDEGGMRVPYQSKSARRTQPDGEVIASAMKEYQASALRHEANKNDESGSNAAQNGQQQQQVDEWRPRFRTLRLNGMPRYWMHEDIVKFVDLVAAQAEIPTPAVAEEEESWNSHGDASPSNSAVPVARSPFIARLKVPYGRRTGLLYGSPEIEIKSSRLADHLLKRLVFEPDDYRSRISFSEVPLHELKRRWDAQEEKRARLRLMSQNLHSGEDGSGTSATDASEDWMLSEEEELKLEQQYVLETLELDRYLLAPDLLYDLAKMQQRRLITRSGKVILPTFRDTYDEKDAVASEIGMNEEPPAASPRRKRSSSRRKRVKTSVRADDNPELGRGSPQNMPIQKPYVHGRPEFIYLDDQELQMGKWGQKNKWAKLFFTPLDSPGEVEEAHATSSSSSISTTTKELSSQREHRKKAQSPSKWKCSRCEAVITVPLDVTTKRPSFVVFAQHLEGNNKNVPVCAAGAIKYEEEGNAASDATAASSLLENPKPTPESQEKETITQLEKVLREANASNGARIIIAVDDPKTPANMGSILRAVHCYGASGVIYSGERLNEALKHTPTDTRQSWRRIPIVHTPKLSSLIKVVKSMQEARVNSERKGENIDTHEGAAAVDVPQVHLIAVDLIDAAESLPLFIHPDQRTGTAAARIEGGNHADASVATMVVVVYVFGPEDGTLSQETIDSCDAAVYMPTVGSMNLAASVNVLLYDRCAKHVRNASGDAIRMKKRVRKGESSEIAGTIDDEKRNRENENDNNSDDDDDDAMRQLEADVMRNRNPNNRTKWQKPASN